MTTITTRFVNDRNHEVSEGSTIIGYVTRAYVFPNDRPALGVTTWGFTASKQGLALGYADTQFAHPTWQAALPDSPR
jgi:hypothetical protein